MNGKKLKEVVWSPNALDAARKFPSGVKKEIGDLILWLQFGETLAMPHSRPMPGIGGGCRELRVRGEDGIYRVFYFLKVKDKILVFHAFQKKTQKTLKREIEKGKKKLKEIV